MSDTTLFELPAVAEPAAKLSPDRRRTQLQAQRIANGLHPLVGVAPWIRLHPDAPKDRTSPGPRCGTCWHRVILDHHRRSYAKCDADDGIRKTNSAASDVRAYWPACRDYSPGDRLLSPDAARFIPGGVS